MSQPRIRVLFICLGNICRSPVAEGVFRHIVGEAGLADRFEIDSAGTASYHEGEGPDSRSAQVALARGVRLTGRARPVTERDVRDFDYLIVMDSSNARAVRRLAAQVHPDAEVRLLREFDPDARGELDVPDPYYGGPRGFEDVHDIIDRSCRALLEHIREEREVW